MDFSFLSDYFMPVVTGICLCVGYVIKKWIKDVDNKWIPTVNAVLGILLAVAVNWSSLDAAVLLGGLVSGLAATGLHQAFKQVVDGKEA